MRAHSGPARSPARAIRAMLLVQVLLGAVLFGGDLVRVLPGLMHGAEAPRLDTPVRPGDQTRRYAPDSLPYRSATPDRPYPAPGKMPSRLLFATERVDGAEAITLTGKIRPGDSERFADWLEARAEPPGRVMLNSTGGSIADALAIGRRLRRAGMETEVGAGDVCLSACPYVLAGGTVRRVHTEATVGVHQHYFGENALLPAFLAVEEVQRGQGKVLAYLTEMGVDPALMRHSLATPPERIYVLLAEELARYDLATEIIG